jgi:alpha-glucosidase
VFQVAATAQNYTDAGIPIETHWSDIDIYDHREAFSTNPQLWTRDKVRSMVDWLHGRGQRYILMQDPAIAARDNPTYHRGLASDAFIKNWNGDNTR